MKVRELIEKLSEMDPEAVVYTNRTDCCEEFDEADMAWPTVETKRDYSKRYDAPDAYKTIDSVRIS